ncbi:hypothetical protein [Serinicoccus kebangsaanensis]|uniref:hypothetical protein n=1 Tax=Serinicoccus kebangsaanensis TaxID=2602069 RepID=UPI00124F62DC|nr:hypothetical protein [Serinicoccus kebangsaanensis]
MIANDMPLAEVTCYPGTGAHRWLNNALANRLDGHVFLMDRDTEPRVEYLVDGIERFLTYIFELGDLQHASIFLVAEVVQRSATSITARAWLAIHNIE